MLFSIAKKPEFSFGFLRTNKLMLWVYLNLSADFTRSSFLMALLAKTNNTIATIETSHLSQKQELFLQICLVNDKQTIPKLNLKSCSICP
jgi:hypothetical protein